MRVLGELTRLIDQRKKQKSQKDSFHLTKRESLIVALNATGIETAEIAKLMFIERKTAENLFANASKKMSVKNRLDLALAALRVGLVKIARLSEVKEEE